MVLDRKTNFFPGKRWFWRTKPTFRRKKMVLGRKTNFSLGKTKKTPKIISWETMQLKYKTMVFFGFP